MADVDREALEAAAAESERGLATTEGVAERLGVSKEEAQDRLSALSKTGYVVGKAMGGWRGESDQEIGWRLAPKGRTALGLEG